jgi:hypothetical protein
VPSLDATSVTAFSPPGFNHLVTEFVDPLNIEQQEY